MDIIDPLVVVELNRQTPVPYNVPWTAHDFLDHDLLRHVLKRFDAAGRPHSQFFIAADEIRLFLYEDLSREPVDWCSQPIALAQLPGREGFVAPLSGCGPPDFAYTTHFKQLVAKNENRRRSRELHISSKIQHRLGRGGIKEPENSKNPDNPKNLKNPKAKRTAEDASLDDEMAASNKTARHVAPNAHKKLVPKKAAAKKDTPKTDAPKKDTPKKAVKTAAPEMTAVRRTTRKMKTEPQDG